MRALILLCVLVGTALGKPTNEKAQERVSYRGHKLYSVSVDTPLEAEFLRELQNDDNLELDFWRQPAKGDVHIRVKPKLQRKFTETLERAGMKYNVLHADLERMVENERQTLSKSAGSRDFTSTYIDLNAVDAVLQELADSFPERVQRFNLAETTFEGRNVWGIKVSTDLTGNSNKKAIWVETGTHAREFVTISVGLATIDNLVRLYGGTGATATMATQMLDMYDWYIVPVHNPDGYQHAFYNERFWRKNRRNLGVCMGVDLNRNWDANWSGAGASGSMCSDTYYGSSALSEPETYSLHQAVASTPRVSAFISIHSYSQYILLPYGYTSVKPSDYNTLLNIANAAKTELESYYRTRYIVGTPPDILYVASGGAFDHMKVVNGIKYVYTYELRPSSSGNPGLNGFDLPVSQIQPTIVETFASLWKFAEQINADEARSAQ